MQFTIISISTIAFLARSVVFVFLSLPVSGTVTDIPSCRSIPATFNAPLSARADYSDICGPDASYASVGNGVGNEMVGNDAKSQDECCHICQVTPGCVANGWFGGCLMLVHTVESDDAAPTAQCPAGTDSYDFGPLYVGGSIHKGPCAA